MEIAISELPAHQQSGLVIAAHPIRREVGSYQSYTHCKKTRFLARKSWSGVSGLLHRARNWPAQIFQKAGQAGSRW